MMPDNAIGQLRTGFPEGAPSALDLWKKETGIEVEVVGASSTDIFTKVMQDVTTGDGSIDVYSGPWNSTGDLVASGGALDCTDYVTKYQPDWGDPERGVSTKEVEQLLYTYNGKYYSLVELVKRTGMKSIPVSRRPMAQVNQAIDDLHHGKVIGRAVLIP